MNTTRNDSWTFGLFHDNVHVCEEVILDIALSLGLSLLSRSRSVALYGSDVDGNIVRFSRRFLRSDMSILDRESASQKSPEKRNSIAQVLVLHSRREPRDQVVKIVKTTLRI